MGLFDSISQIQQNFTPAGLAGINMGSLTGSTSVDAALAAQQQAAQQANATQKYIYDQNRSDNQPWTQAGASAIKQMQDPNFQKSFTMADFQADPGYAFRMQEGQKAIERSAAAKGGLNSGATMKALTNYGQNAASQEYQNAYDRFNNDRTTNFNRLASIAGVGQTANSTVANSGVNYGNQVSQNQIGIGNSAAAANIAKGNGMANLLGQGATLGTMAFSDERLKTNIEPISAEDLKEMKSHLKAYRFNYKDQKHGDGDWIGVMAQDLEKSKLGRGLVVEDSEGNKMINLGKVMSLFLATMAEG